MRASLPCMGIVLNNNIRYPARPRRIIVKELMTLLTTPSFDFH